MNSELYKDMYKFEWEQRSHLSSAVNIPIVAITALGTVLATIALGYPYESSCKSLLFPIAAALTALLISIAIGFVIFSLINSKYSKLPSPLKLRNYYSELCEWHTKNGSTVEAASKEFQANFDSHLAQVAEANGVRNRIRGNSIFLASVFLSLSLIPLGIAGFYYVTAKINAPDKVQSFRIVK